MSATRSFKMAISFFSCCLLACETSTAHHINLPDTISKTADISLQPDYTRIKQPDSSFGTWLRTYPLKRSKTVKYFDGKTKPDQSAVYAVLDMKTGDKDLQQCADAIIRARAEFLLKMGKVEEIWFLSTSMQKLSFKAWCGGQRFRVKGNLLEVYSTGERKLPNAHSLDQWLPFVFTYAGTYSLQKQLKQKPAGAVPEPGDVVIEAGFPGHAMLVMDVAKNSSNKYQFILAQSYMPAQDMHIVVNTRDRAASPWYKGQSAGQRFNTPDWSFRDLRFYSW